MKTFVLMTKMAHQDADIMEVAPKLKKKRVRKMNGFRRSRSVALKLNGFPITPFWASGTSWISTRHQTKRQPRLSLY